MRYQANAPTVISETIGGETIIVNLSTGCYYSLQGTGVDIWEGVVERAPASAIAGRLEARYTGDRAQLEAAVASMLEELERDELIVPATAAATLEEPHPETGERKPFVPPGLHKFTDMQDIIMLDPVHEVDERGWPHAAPDRSAPAA